MLHDYIAGRVERSDVRKYMKFCHAVRHVAFDDATGLFTVTVKDLVEDRMLIESFDRVVVATGHFSTPNVPYFDGLEKFPGRVMHSHDFRSADEFKGKHVLVIGGSYSAEDIGIQCYKYGATLCHFQLPDEADGLRTGPRACRKCRYSPA